MPDSPEDQREFSAADIPFIDSSRLAPGAKIQAVIRDPKGGFDFTPNWDLLAFFLCLTIIAISIKIRLSLKKVPKIESAPERPAEPQRFAPIASKLSVDAPEFVMPKKVGTSKEVDRDQASLDDTPTNKINREETE